MKKKHLGYALGAVFGLALAAPALLHGAPVHAQPLNPDELFGGTLPEDFANNAGVTNAELPTVIANIIRIILGFLGIVAVVIVLFGGFKWMTAGGNDDKVSEAKQLIIQGIIGMVIIFSAFAIASFVVNSISSALG